MVVSHSGYLHDPYWGIRSRRHLEAFLPRISIVRPAVICAVANAVQVEASILLIKKPEDFALFQTCSASSFADRSVVGWVGIDISLIYYAFLHEYYRTKNCFPWSITTVKNGKDICNIISRSRQSQQSKLTAVEANDCL